MLVWPEIGRKEEIMSEFTKDEMEIFFQDGKMYLECNAPSGKVRLAEMTMGHRTDSVADAEELVRRWNSQPDLLEALEKIYECGSIMKAEQLANAAIEKATHKP